GLPAREVVVGGERFALGIEDGQYRIERRAEAAGEDFQAETVSLAGGEAPRVDFAGGLNAAVKRGGHGEGLSRGSGLRIFQMLGQVAEIEPDGIGAATLDGGPEDRFRVG